MRSDEYWKVAAVGYRPQTFGLLVLTLFKRHGETLTNFLTRWRCIVTTKKSAHAFCPQAYSTLSQYLQLFTPLIRHYNHWITITPQNCTVSRPTWLTAVLPVPPEPGWPFLIPFWVIVWQVGHQEVVPSPELFWFYLLHFGSNLKKGTVYINTTGWLEDLWKYLFF